jgi:hypothetical protein
MTMTLDKTPVTAEDPTICAVCAWRADCKKKFSYDSGGPVKCAEFTRDVACKSDEERHS